MIQRLYPASLAEDWDNVGLQVGDPTAEVHRVLIGLDPTEDAVQQALDDSAQLLLTHHPLLFKPIKKLTPTDETGRILFAAIQNNLAIISAHTNLDRGINGLNDWLGKRIGLEAMTPLAPGDGPDLVKLVVFVPADAADTVAEAIFAVGAGHIGRYDQCSFQLQGTGTFRPNTGAEPAIGTVGQSEQVAEIRLETILRQDQTSRVVSRMIKAHPYEEVAYDLYPLLNRQQNLGMGRVGRLPETTSLEAFAAKVKQALGGHSVRVSGPVGKPVRKVGLCSGSGASMMSDAIRQGVDVLVTGDVKYHDARRAESEGIGLIDAGHFATEQIMAEELATVLRQEAASEGWAIAFQTIQGVNDPFRVL